MRNKIKFCDKQLKVDMEKFDEIINGLVDEILPEWVTEDLDFYDVCNLINLLDFAEGDELIPCLIGSDVHEFGGDRTEIQFYTGLDYDDVIILLEIELDPEEVTRIKHDIEKLKEELGKC